MSRKRPSGNVDASTPRIGIDFSAREETSDGEKRIFSEGDVFQIMKAVDLALPQGCGWRLSIKERYGQTFGPIALCSGLFTYPKINDVSNFLQLRVLSCYGTGVVILGKTYEESYLLFSCVGCYRLNSSVCSGKPSRNSSNVFVNSSYHSTYN